MEGGVAVVTGAGKGIGRAIAINLAEERFSVGLVGREAGPLAEVAEACRALGVRAEYYPVDLARVENISDLVPQIADDLGGISVLVNNAGICIERTIREATLADWDATQDVNLRAVFALTKYALPYLERASGAAVINIASIAGQRTYLGGSMYSASKHGVLGFSGSLFHDVREQGIKVCAISPGYVNTDMHSGDVHLDPQKMIQPEDIAAAVRFVVNFPARSCPTEITILPQKSPKI